MGSTSSALAGSPPPVQFLGAPSPAFKSGVSFPIGVTSDPAGNVYIANYSADNVLKETVQSDGSYVQSVVISSLPSGPVGIAVDAQGNLYLGLNGSGLYKETVQPDGTFVQSAIGASNLYEVYGVAVDASGNVYASSYTSGTVTKFSPANGAYTAATIFSEPYLRGLTLDQNGDVFVAGSYNNAIYKLVPSGNPATTTTYTQSTITLGSGTSAFDIAVDAVGNLYVADTSGKLRLENLGSGGTYTETILASGLTQSYGVGISTQGTIYFGNGSAVDHLEPTAVNLGTQTLGKTTSVSTLTYEVQPSTVIGSVNVVTQGAVNTQTGSPEFVQSSGSTCTAQTYSGVTTCSVQVTFTPQFPGLRTGAVQILDGSGNVLNTAYLYGQGSAPVIAFSSGSTVALAPTGLGTTPLGQTRGGVVDAAGNLYLADPVNNRIVEVAPGGAATVLATPGVTLSAPAAIAIDGAGNRYIADSGNGRVVEVSAQGIASVLDTNSIALATNYGIAVDGYGNVYTTDATNNRVIEFPALGAPHVLSVTGVTLGSVHGVAADGAGNVYIADFSNSQIVKVDTTGAASVLPINGLSSPEAVSVDAVGNLYVTDTGNNRIIELSKDSSTPTVLGTGSNALQGPLGALVGNVGDLYISDAGNKQVLVRSLEGLPSFAFADTIMGQVSADSPQAFTMMNLGNAPLSIAVPTAGTNPSIAAGFTVDGASTCPQVSAGSSAASLAAGATCTYAINFAPQENGTFSGSLALTDNNLDATAAIQQIPLTGNGLLPGDNTATTVVANPAAIAFGAPVDISATVADTTTTTTHPTGSVTFTDTVGSTTVSLNGGAAVPLVNGTATLTGVMLNGTGNHSIAANYAGVQDKFIASTNSAVLPVQRATATLTGPSAPVFVVYGTSTSIPFSLAGQYSSATAPSGSVSYTIQDATTKVVATGTDTIGAGALTVPVASTMAPGNYTILLNYTGDTNYLASASPVSIALTVGQIQPVINWTAPAGSLTYGQNLSSVLTATVVANGKPVDGTLLYSNGTMPVTATSVLPAGNFTITAQFTPADKTTYKAATSTIALSVSKSAVAGISVVSSAPTLLSQNPVTFTATVSSAVSTPTGSVVFMDSASKTPLATVPLTSGVAVYTTSELAVGTHSITAAYSGDANFLGATSSATSEQIDDFNLDLSISSGSTGSAATSSQTVAPGQVATYNFTVTPTGSATFPGDVALTVTGLPEGAKYTLTPSMIAKGSGSTEFTLKVSVPSITAQVKHEGEKGAPLVAALLLLPFSAALRRRAGKLGSLAATLMLVVLTGSAMACLTGCGASTGYFGQAQKSYTVTITGTSGALTHSSTVTLNVE